MLKAGLDDPNRHVRFGVVSTLCNRYTDDPDRPAALAKRLTKEKDDYIRQMLQFALKEIREKQNPPATQPGQ